MITTINQEKEPRKKMLSNFTITKIPSDPVKKEVTIKYNSYGIPQPGAVDLGLYGDCNVTVLIFDFSQLAWTTTPIDRYQLNLFVDGRLVNNFEISAENGYTAKYAIDTTELGIGTHAFAVSIIEQGINTGSNINEQRELYICRSFNGTINASSYRKPGQELNYEGISGQGLRRHSIEVMLADDGKFNLKGMTQDEHYSTDLGVQYDRFVSYICFNSKDDVTSKIESLTKKYIVFQRNEQENYYVSLVKSEGHLHEGQQPTLMA